VQSTALFSSLSDSTELFCDSDKLSEQLPKKIAMDKINPTAIMKNLFVFSCFIVYFFKKVYTTKKAPTEVSAIFVK
jgi:hypothetical protein